MQLRPWRRLILGQIVIAVCGAIAILLGVSQLAGGTDDRQAWGLVVVGCILAAIATSLVIFGLVIMRRLRKQTDEADGRRVGE